MGDHISLAIVLVVTVFAALELIYAVSKNNMVSLISGFVAFFGIIGLAACIHFHLRSVQVVGGCVATMAVGLGILHARNRHPTGPGAAK